MASRHVYQHTSGQGPPDQDRGSGFTLLEVLLALSLTATVLVIAVRLTHQSLLAEKTARGQVIQAVRDRLLEQVLRQDLYWVQTSNEPSRPSITSSPQNGEALAWTQLDLRSTPDLPAGRRLPCSVVYRLGKDHKLIRASTQLTEKTPSMEQRVVARDLASVRAEFWIQNRWQDAAGTDPTGGLPDAIRLTVRKVGSDTDSPPVVLRITHGQGERKSEKNRRVSRPS